MGSQSDWTTMRHAAETLEALGVPLRGPASSPPTARPKRMMAYASGRQGPRPQGDRGRRGRRRPHLPGNDRLAHARLPVLGVPVESAAAPEGPRQSSFHCPRDAGRHPGRHARHRPGRARSTQPCWPPASSVLATSRSWRRFERLAGPARPVAVGPRRPLGRGRSIPSLMTATADPAAGLDHRHPGRRASWAA